MDKYDVFISYRREGGYETAKHLSDLLRRDGYKVSFDIETLRSGDFDTQLYRRIDYCTDFILIVDQHAFDRTIIKKIPREKDWLRCELAYALHKNKNIIPIFLTGISKFPDNLPDDIIGVTKKNGPEYNRYYFDDFYRVLKKRFLHDKRGIWKKILVMIISGVLMCGLIFVFINESVSFENSAENKLLLAQDSHYTNSKNESKPTQNIDSTREANSDKEILVSDKKTSSVSQISPKSEKEFVERSSQSKKASSSKQKGSSLEVKSQAPTKQNSRIYVYDIDELMKMAASGEPRAYVPLAKYYYQNASGMSSYERVHIYSMKAINANVDVAEAKKLINNIDALGFYHSNNKYKKPNF